MLIERSMRLITSAHKGCQIDHGTRWEPEERAVAHWRHQRPGEAPVEGRPQHWLEGQNLLPLVSAAPPGWRLHQVAQPPPTVAKKRAPSFTAALSFLLRFAECVSTRALGWWWTRASSSTPQWGEEGSGSFVSRRRTSSGPTCATAAMVRHASTHRHTALASGPLSGL